MRKVLILSFCALLVASFTDANFFGISFSTGRPYHRSGLYRSGRYYHNGGWQPLAGLLAFSLANMNNRQRVSTLENKIDQLVNIIKSQSDRIKDLQGDLERCKKKGRII